MLQHLDIVYAPLLPPALIAAGLALALALIVLLARSGAGRVGLLLRAAFACTLAFMLLGPQLRQQQREPLADIALVVADHSASQRLDGRGERTGAALAALRRTLRALPRTQVRTVILPADDGSRGTRLIGALKRALTDIPPERFAGAFLLTDGEVHDMPADPRSVLPAGYVAPVHVLISGRKNERDRWLQIVRAGDYGIIGKELELRFRLRQQPRPEVARPVEVTVRLDGKVLRRLQVLPGTTHSVRLPVRHAGDNVVELIAEAMDEAELSSANNHLVHVFKGVRDRLRVLLISGRPHPGERVWRNLLKSDPMVDLVHFTILRPPQKQDGTPISELALIAFPTYELFVEKLRNFDLIIFDRYQRRSILTAEYLRNIADYVRDGGAVLLTAGPEFAQEDSLFHTPLADVLPVAPSGRVLEEPFRPRLTENGRRHPLTAALAPENASPPWGRWFRLIEARLPRERTGERPQVLMSGPRDMPLLVTAREGKGRVAVLLSDQIWLWARRFDGGGPYVELVRRLAHWLMKEPDLEEEQLRAALRGDALIIRRRTLAGRAAPLLARTPGGEELRPPWRKIAAGLFEARIENPAPGLYRLKSGALMRVFAVGAADVPENRNLLATEAILKPLARATGGAVRWIADANGNGVSLPAIVKVAKGAPAAGGGWLGIVRGEAARVLAVRHFPLFNGLAPLAALLLLLLAAWRFESR